MSPAQPRAHARVLAEERNIADEATVRAICDENGMDGAALVAARRRRRRRTSGTPCAEAIERQVFGAPWYVYDGTPFWARTGSTSSTARSRIRELRRRSSPSRSSNRSTAAPNASAAADATCLAFAQRPAAVSFMRGASASSLSRAASSSSRARSSAAPTLSIQSAALSWRGSAGAGVGAIALRQRGLGGEQQGGEDEAAHHPRQRRARKESCRRDATAGMP